MPKYGFIGLGIIGSPMSAILSRLALMSPSGSVRRPSARPWWPAAPAKGTVPVKWPQAATSAHEASFGQEGALEGICAGRG